MQDNQTLKGDQLQTRTEPSTIPSHGDANPPTMDPQLQQTSAVDTDVIADDALRAAKEAALVALKGEDPEGVSVLDQDSVSILYNHDVSVSPPQHISANQLSQTSPLDTAVLLNEANMTAAFPQRMDIHHPIGTFLHHLGEDGEIDPGKQPLHQPDAPVQTQQVTQNHQAGQTAAVQEAAQVILEGKLPSQQSPIPLPHSSGSITSPVAQPSPRVIAVPVQPLTKPTRLRGHKQCPSCQNLIAAALAKCPECPHVFRVKKEKVKKSGKRGRKNCPKCSFESPSACSCCKNCNYIFRIKLTENYGQTRLRPTSDTAAAAGAAAAHAAANMTGQHAGITALPTLPMHAGVAAYPNMVAQPLHSSPFGVSIIPFLAENNLYTHPNAHNVDDIGVPQVHPLPQYPLHHHQTHPQL